MKNVPILLLGEPDLRTRGQEQSRKGKNRKVGSSTAEKSLVAKLVAALRKTKRASKPLTVISELDCFQGIADVVSGVLSGPRLLPGFSKRKLGTLSFSTSRILATLVHKKRVTIANIAEATGLSLATIRSELSALQKRGLVQVSNREHVTVLLPIRIPFKEITAYEVKVKDWKNGIYQARNYKSFAHKVSVVLPLARARRLTQKLPEFRRMRVGLVGIGPEGNLKWLLKPRRRTPISPPRHFHAVVRLLKDS